MQQHGNSNRVMEARDHFKNGAGLKSHTSRKKFEKYLIMKKVFLILVAAISFTTMSYAQFGIGRYASWGSYKWDKNPTTNSPEFKGSSGTALVNLSMGPNLCFGTEDFRLIVNGYAQFAPFSLSLTQMKGLGTASFGSMSKVSITPYGLSGFSIGVGWQTTKTDLYARPDACKDMQRDWYSVLYGYLAFSIWEEVEYIDGFTNKVRQTDFFVKYGRGKNSAIMFEIGVSVDGLIFWD